MEFISDGQVIVIQRHNYMRTHRLNVAKSRNVQLGKETVDMSAVVGSQFGDTFKMVHDGGEGGKKGGSRKWKLEKTDDAVNFEELFLDGEDGDGVGGRDNRDLVDQNSSQKLSKDDIEGMRDSGTSGEKVMAALIENSDTFSKKTKFSQAKFLKKKARKYCEYLVIRKPTLRLLAQIAYKTDPMKIMNLRLDSLSQLLCQANVRAGGKYLVYETGCQGLVVAGAVERVGAQEGGKVVHVYQTGNPQTQSLDAMNFSQDVLDNLLTLNMYHLRSMEAGEDITKMHQKPEADAPQSTETAPKVPHRQRLREQSVRSFDLMQADDKMDGLIIACKQHPTSILLALMKYLAPSRPFAVFSPYKEPLLDAYLAVKDTGRAIMCTVSETWMRNHQVLPGRTHPEVLMSGGGGYLLTGTYVDNTEVEGFTTNESTPAAERNGGGGPKRKKFRRR